MHTGEEVREILNQCERNTIAAHGYGLNSFRKSLVACFERLTDAPVTREKHARIVAFAHSIAEQEIELLPGVEETLATLAAHHRCLLVTKGDRAEQLDKLARSGLARYFDAAEVLPEKTEAAYREIVARHHLVPARTWMIGNSPRSDLNPALAAGLNAVFLPHDFTWVLEHEIVAAPPPGQRLVTLGSFPELQQLFTIVKPLATGETYAAERVLH